MPKSITAGRTRLRPMRDRASVNDRHYDSFDALTREEPHAINALARFHRDEPYVTLRDTGVYGGGGPRRQRRWWGLPTMDDVLRVTRRGWPDGVALMRSSLRALAPGGAGRVTRRRVRGDFGDHLDIHRVYAGDLSRAWHRTVRAVRRDAGRYVVTLLADVSAHGKQTAEELFWRGAVATLLTDALEQSGRRVRVVGYSETTGAYPEHRGLTVSTVSFEIKAANQPLNIDRVAVATALAATERVWVWRAHCAAADELSSDIGGARFFRAGRVTDDTFARLPDALQRLAGTEATIIVDGIWSRDAAQAFLDSTLAGFGAAQGARAG